MKYALLTGTISLGAIAGLSILHAAPAEAAFSYSQNHTAITIDSDDVGRSFWAVFGGQVDDQGITSTDVDGLDSAAKFTISSLTSNQIVFDILLKNLSTAPITASVVTALGFASSPEIESATATGDFDVFAEGTFNSFGGTDIDFCFKSPGSNDKNCNGGKANTGVALGEQANFQIALNYGSGVDLLTNGVTYSEFGVRYQGIDGEINGVFVQDFSGTGGPGVVPTPALIPSLIGMGIAAMRKKQQEEEAEADVEMETVA